MDRPTLYDSDILAWSEQQVAVLRRMAARGELPDEIDLENVVEEIGCVGRTQLRRTNRLICHILVNVAKAVSQPDGDFLPRARAECVGWHTKLLRSFSPSMRQRIDIDSLWESALKLARAVLEVHGGALADGLQGPCPIGLDELLSSDFEFQDAVRRIANWTG